MRKNNTFRSKGAEILAHRKGLDNMGDFLELNKKTDVTVTQKKRPNAPIPESAIAQSRNVPPTHPRQASKLSNRYIDTVEVTRLHVHIRRDLADRLFEEVFSRKWDRSVPNKFATQRVVIEHALDAYFKDRNVSHETNP